MITLNLTNEEAQSVKEGLSLLRQQNLAFSTYAYDLGMLIKEIADLEDADFTRSRAAARNREYVRRLAAE